MESIILAGGLGTRLRDFVSDLPKPMAPIRGKPFLEILLENFVKKGVHQVVLAVGYKASVIINYFGSKFNGIDIIYSVESAPLGTGGALRAALSMCSEEYIYVANGDTFLDFDVTITEKVLTDLRGSTVFTTAVDDASRYGRLEVKEGRIIGFAEKGISGAGKINAGHYLLRKNCLRNFEAFGSFSFEKEFLTPEADAGRLYEFNVDGKFIDIGVPEDYVRAQDLF